MLANNNEYFNWLKSVKQQIKSSRIKAALAVNSQLILLYWNLGRQIVEKQQYAKWGSGFITQLSKDLKAEFPDMGGLSRANLFRTKMFYSFYSERFEKEYDKIPQVVRQLGNTKVAQVVR